MKHPIYEDVKGIRKTRIEWNKVAERRGWFIEKIRQGGDCMELFIRDVRTMKYIGTLKRI